jgi:hypothetical protein
MMKLTRRQAVKLLSYAGPAIVRTHTFAADDPPIDLVVYGATASGVMTADEIPYSANTPKRSESEFRPAAK